MFQQGENSITARIKRKVVSHFAPLTYQLINDSHKHGSADLDAKRETHFTLLLVSKSFEKETNINRHRRVYQALHQELGAGVHALALHLYTPSEWQAMSEDEKARVRIAPPCARRE